MYSKFSYKATSPPTLLFCPSGTVLSETDRQSANTASSASALSIYPESLYCIIFHPSVPLLSSCTLAPPVFFLPISSTRISVLEDCTQTAAAYFAGVDEELNCLGIYIPLGAAPHQWLSGVQYS